MIASILFWLGIALLVIGVMGLATGSSREKGEYWSPAAILVSCALWLVHVYNYASLAGWI